jgi:hypothetical protein
MRVYRYDDQEHQLNDVLHPRGDHFEILSDAQKVVECAIRACSDEMAHIRKESVYTWKDEAFAKRVFNPSKKRFLYELDVQSKDIRFVGDLDHYSAAVDAVKQNMDYAPTVSLYCAGDIQGSRVEVLVAKATVVGIIAVRH